MISKEEERKNRQLNIGLVPEETAKEINKLINRLNAELNDPYPKRELLTAAVIKFLTSQLSWIDSKDVTRKEAKIEEFTEEMQRLLKKTLMEGK